MRFLKQKSVLKLYLCLVFVSMFFAANLNMCCRSQNIIKAMEDLCERSSNFRVPLIVVNSDKFYLDYSYFNVNFDTLLKKSKDEVLCYFLDLIEKNVHIFKKYSNKQVMEKSYKNLVSNGVIKNNCLVSEILSKINSLESLGGEICNYRQYLKNIDLNSKYYEKTYKKSCELISFLLELEAEFVINIQPYLKEQIIANDALTIKEYLNGLVGFLAVFNAYMEYSAGLKDRFYFVNDEDYNNLPKEKEYISKLSFSNKQQFTEIINEYNNKCFDFNLEYNYEKLKIDLDSLLKPFSLGQGDDVLEKFCDGYSDFYKHISNIIKSYCKDVSLSTNNISKTNDGMAEEIVGMHRDYIKILKDLADFLVKGRCCNKDNTIAIISNILVNSIFEDMRKNCSNNECCNVEFDNFLTSTAFTDFVKNKDTSEIKDEQEEPVGCAYVDSKLISPKITIDISRLATNISDLFKFISKFVRNMNYTHNFFANNLFNSSEEKISNMFSYINKEYRSKCVDEYKEKLKGNIRSIFAIFHRVLHVRFILEIVEHSIPYVLQFFGVYGGLSKQMKRLRYVWKDDELYTKYFARPFLNYISKLDECDIKRYVEIFVNNFKFLLYNGNNFGEHDINGHKLLLERVISNLQKKREAYKRVPLNNISGYKKVELIFLNEFLQRIKKVFEEYFQSISCDKINNMDYIEEFGRDLKDAEDWVKSISLMSEFANWNDENVKKFFDGIYYKFQALRDGIGGGMVDFRYFLLGIFSFTNINEEDYNKNINDINFSRLELSDFSGFAPESLLNGC